MEGMVGASGGWSGNCCCFCFGFGSGSSSSSRCKCVELGMLCSSSVGVVLVQVNRQN